MSSLVPPFPVDSDSGYVAIREASAVRAALPSSSAHRPRLLDDSLRQSAVDASLSPGLFISSGYSC